MFFGRYEIALMLPLLLINTLIYNIFYFAKTILFTIFNYWQREKKHKKNVMKMYSCKKSVPFLKPAIMRTPLLPVTTPARVTCLEWLR
jgi:hypothetical protein